MASKDRKPFENPVIEWVDSRLPVFTMIQREYGVFPTPRNFNYFWNFGALAMVVLVTMILTGIFLAMHYTPHQDHAFDSVERIMRDVNYGWLLRYIHMNGASMFFIVVYIHIFRGLYYGSYKKPRELLWILGVVIFVLMMATAFMGYTLPWSQMSGWGATVITSLFGAVPFVGDSIVSLLWGGFSVDNPTLNRFFALHYLFPFLIVGVVVLHIWALHVTGSNNPLGIEPQSKRDTIPFHPYYTMKDMFGLSLFLIFFAFVVFFAPNYLTHADHFVPFDPLVTPPHIVPEWYFLPFYAILRAITFDFNIYIVASIGVAVFGALPIYTKRDLGLNFARIGAVMGIAGVLFLLGFLCQTQKADGSMILSLPFSEFKFMSAKLGGVGAMFSSLVLLALMPWLDWHPVRSARFRPLYKIALIGLVLDVVLLGYIGAQVAEQPWIIIGQLATLYYFAFFLIITPLLSRIEKAKPLPTSIYAAVTKKAAVMVMVGAAMLTLAAPQSQAAEDAPTPPAQEWSFQGMTGTYDKAALQRGFQVYREVCAACHGLSRVAYRNLSDLGYNEDQIKAVAGEVMIMDGPNDEGEMYERPGRPSDRFKSPFANEQAARYANNGAYPLDLSLIAKARHNGADYIHALLTGYKDAPEGFELSEGMYYNEYFAGHQIAMAPPLSEGQIMFADETEGTVAQMAHDVATFLTWAAEPHQDRRKMMGVKVLLFLIVLSALMYGVKKKIWRHLEDH